MVDAGSWRSWARRYTTAALLTLAQLSIPVAGRLRSRPAIVRLVDRRFRGRYDPRELGAPSVVLTVPLEVDRHAEPTTSNRDVANLN